MTVTPKQLENLKKGEATRFVSGERAARLGSLGRKGQARTQERQKNLIELFEIAQRAKVPDEKIAQRLRNAGLPDTFAGQMAYNVIQKAGTNPLMLQTLLKALGLLNDNANVTVNAMPIIIGGEDELK